MPTLICYCDVSDSASPGTFSFLCSPLETEDIFKTDRTQTDRYYYANWNAHRPANIKLTSHIHYRQVTGEAGYTLEHMAGSRELIRGARDAFQGM